MPAPKGNRNASRPEEDRRVFPVYVRLRQNEKLLCESAAGDAGIGKWAREVLLKEAERVSR